MSYWDKSGCEPQVKRDARPFGMTRKARLLRCKPRRTADQNELASRARLPQVRFDFVALIWRQAAQDFQNAAALT